MNVARFNFSHGEHAAHQEVLDRFRKVVAERAATGGKGQYTACLLDTKGPEVRTAMLKDGKDIELEAGQEIIVFAAGDDYTSFEGYKNESETKIGCSYAKLCQSVKPGNRLLFADGSIVIEVVEIIDEKNLKGKVLNSNKLGQRKNGNLPGVRRAVALARSLACHSLSC
jgi:pyruvate kinase